MKHLTHLLFLLATGLSIFVGNVDTALAQATSLSASATQITFNGQAGMGSSVPAQTVNLTSTGASASFTVGSISSTGNWLVVTPLTGNTPAALSVSVNGNADVLFPQNYTGQFVISSPGLPSIMVTVFLNLSGTTGVGLSANPNPVVFNVAQGSTSLVQQQLVISNTNGTTTASIFASTGSGGNWLSVSTSSTTVPGTITVVANPTGLTNGNYTGSITITPATGTVLAVPVMLNVGTTTGTTLAVSPSPFPTVTVQAGSTVPVNQILTVTTTSSSVTFSAGATTTDGFNWLSVNPPQPQTVTPTTPAQLTVSINPANLAANTYNGTITLTPQTGSVVTIPVTLLVSGSPALTVSPAMLSFAYQTSTAFPPAQTLTIGSSGSALSFSAAATTQTGGGWLIVSPANGGTSSGGLPAVISVQVNPSGLLPGTYNGQISINANSASNSPLTIPVTLVVSNQPILALGNSGTTFTYQLGTALPTAQTVTVSSSGNQLNFTATAVPGTTGGAFLNVTPSSGTTPQPLSFTLNPAVLAGLGTGTYTETVSVNAPGAGNSPQNYPVTLIVSNSTLLAPSQNALTFNYQIGQSLPLIQTVGVSSTGAPLSYAVAATSTNCGNFLSATPANGTTTAGNIAISVNTAGLAAGTCMGVVSISSPGAGNAVNIPVTLNVSATPLLNASPSAINLTTQLGTSPANQTIALTSTDPATALNFGVTSMTINGGGWLLIGPTSGKTPLNLIASFTTSGLAVGTYNGSITVTSTGPVNPANSPVVIPVTVVVAPSATASATPAALTFNQAFGGPAPATQTIQLTSTTAGLNFTTTATTFNGGNNWLSVTPAAGLTNQSVTVAANGAGLAQGSYSGVITFQISGTANTPVNVPVTLIVGSAQTLSAAPTSLIFTFQAGSLTAPAARTVQLTSTGGNVPFTATASTVSGQNLVTISPASGNTPGPLSIGLNQTVLATLAPGNYTSQITIASAGLVSQTVNVMVTITAAAPPTVMQVVNTASSVPGAISPGEIITIFGANIGPATPVGLQLTPQGAVSTTLGNTVVTFDGFQAPLIFVSSGQINAIVPYDIAGRVSTTMVVQRNGQSSASLQLQVVDTAPGIFSLSQGGNGQGAILNSNGTVNGAANPAVKGTPIVIYATGEGVLVPQPPTGSVTSAAGPTFPKPLNNVAVTIGGQPATLQYMGEAPGLVSGALQVNAVVPLSVGSGPQTVVLTIGGASNLQQMITVAVQ